MTTKKVVKARKATTRKPAKAAELVVHATDETFAKETGGTTPVLVDLSASWCGPCQRLGKALPAIAEKFAGKVKVVKVDVDESPKTAGRFVDEGVPTVVLLQRGKQIAKDCGFGSRHDTELWLERALAAKAKPGKDDSGGCSCCG
jgi:thioredoxin 2